MNKDETIIASMIEKIDSIEKLSRDDVFLAAGKVKKDDVVSAIIKTLDRVINDENSKG